MVRKSIYDLLLEPSILHNYAGSLQYLCEAMVSLGRTRGVLFCFVSFRCDQVRLICDS